MAGFVGGSGGWHGREEERPDARRLQIATFMYLHCTRERPARGNRIKTEEKLFTGPDCRNSKRKIKIGET